jgi:GT2 family glycosyltransferase
MPAPRVSVVVVSYQARAELVTCLESLRRQSFRDFEVIVVENGSGDGTEEAIRAAFPEVRVLAGGANLGFAAANNLGFKEARGVLVAGLNQDTEADAGWLAELVAALDGDPDLGLATSRVCHFERRDLVNTCGNEVHVTGVGFCRGLDRPAAEFEAAVEVAAISGCAFAAPRSLLERLGGFDEAFFMYMEDTDLSLRSWISGAPVAYVPASIVYHRYELRTSPAKFERLEANRWAMLLKDLRWSSLLALAPALALGELVMWAYALGAGPRYLAAKGRAWGRVISGWRGLMRRRRAAQAERRTGDGVLLGRLTPHLPVEQLLSGRHSRALGGAADLVFGLLSWPARHLLR